MGLAVRCATWLLRSLQYTRFCGIGGYSPEAFQARRALASFPQAERESDSFEEFFALFPPTVDVRSAFAGKDVLDFGSGYGGRTVEFAARCGARFVWGVEPVERCIEQAGAYAAQRHIDNCKFLLCGATSIPLPDESVDVVVSYDVLEHVHDPRQSMREIRRVLRPGGSAIMAFPVYHGALSHHLDYVVRMPGIHWLFGPGTLIAAVNAILAEDRELKRFGTPLQPPPSWSYDHERRVLPTLNGLTGNGFLGMLHGFHVELLYFRPLLASRRLLGAPTRMLMSAGVSGVLRDALTTNIACALVKLDAIVKAKTP